ncbi:MAG TPA: SRPBCC domain-containing protein [Eudoraea sp.]|nr:SRPBCC domain-containing protein [Eudoraea sp.]
MKNNLTFTFDINKESNSVNVEREFAAGLDLVWDAWTKPELLDQWWAPKPYKNVTKSMDFREGGTWLYYMLSPENQKHWCKNDYLKIEPKKSYTGLDAFCDENGTTNEAMPRTKWTNTFNQVEFDKTLVSIVSTYEKLADLEQVIQMGFQEGFTAGLNQLDELLASFKK